LFSVSVAIDQVLVDDRDGGVAGDHARGDGPGLAGRELQLLGLIRVELHDQALDVEDDVGDVLHHAGQAGKLVVAPLSLMWVTARLRAS
jgi:hypothetical protein